MAHDARDANGSDAPLSATEWMTIAAARFLSNDAVCFVGIGLPSKAANLARLTHAPDLVLIYEAGAIGAKPTILPLSIGDGELATTADLVVPTHEIFRYWLQGGRVDVGFLGAAQIDRFANVNTTVIGSYEHPKVRLPGAGGAPEIAAHAREVVLVLPQSRRSFVEKLDFVTTVGFLDGGDSREKMRVGMGKGPVAVVTDFGVLRPDPETKELVLTEIHPGVRVEDVIAATGWKLRVSASLAITKAPDASVVKALRELEAKSNAAHAEPHEKKTRSEKMMRAFVHEPHPARVVFGAGSRARVGEEASRLGFSRVFLIGEGEHAREIKSVLGDRVVGEDARVVMHVPVERARESTATATTTKSDGLVAVGGGSAVGLAKAIAKATGLPILALPTTYAGSEMTSIWGLTEEGEKKTGRDDRVRPRTVIYDPDFTRTLPLAIAGPSAVNALAHAVESLYASDRDPLTMIAAEDGARAIAENLRRFVDARGNDGNDDEPRAGLLYGAWLSGMCLDRTSVGVHHKLCHVLGGTFGLPHADVHAVILPYAAAFNREAAPDAMTRLARALDAKDEAAVPRALYELAQKAGAKPSLAALGFREEHIERAARLATERPYPNPRAVDYAGIVALLRDAVAGHPPS